MSSREGRGVLLWRRPMLLSWQVRLAREIDLADLAADLDGYSGADIHLVCRDAAMMTMRKATLGKSPAEIIELQQSGDLDGEITRNDFAEAMRRTTPTVTDADQAAYKRWDAEYGCSHEAPTQRLALLPPAAPPAPVDPAVATHGAVAVVKEVPAAPTPAEPSAE